jgi:exonuclease III
LLKKIKLICLQETHYVNNDIDRWKSEWKNHGGGDSNWNCGSKESRVVAILLSKFVSNEVKFTFSDNIGRVLKCEVKTETAIFQISNIDAPNISTDRENLLESLLKPK